MRVDAAPGMMTARRTLNLGKSADVAGYPGYVSTLTQVTTFFKSTRMAAASHDLGHGG